MPSEFRTLFCEVVYAFVMYRARCLDAVLAILEDRKWLLVRQPSPSNTSDSEGTPHVHSNAWVWLTYDSDSCVKYITQGTGITPDGK